MPQCIVGCWVFNVDVTLVDVTLAAASSGKKTSKKPSTKQITVQTSVIGTDVGYDGAAAVVKHSAEFAGMSPKINGAVFYRSIGSAPTKFNRYTALVEAAAK